MPLPLSLPLSLPLPPPLPYILLIIPLSVAQQLWLWPRLWSNLSCTPMLLCCCWRWWWQCADSFNLLPFPFPFPLRSSHFPLPLHTVTLLMSKCCNLRHNPRLTSPPCLADNEGLDRKDEADDFSELHAPRFDSCYRLSDSAFVWLCIRPLAIAFCLLIALPSSFCCCCCSLCCRCSSLCCCSFCCCSFCCRLCLLAECKTFKLKV